MPPVELSVSAYGVFVFGPRFETVTVYVMLFDASTGSGESLIAIARSAALIAVATLIATVAGAEVAPPPSVAVYVKESGPV